MEKVEKVLATEEKARHTVADARERAAAIRAAGLTAAANTASDTAAKAAAEAEKERESALAKARAAAVELESSAAGTLEAQDLAARARLDEAARSLAGMLKG